MKSVSAIECYFIEDGIKIDDLIKIISSFLEQLVSQDI